MRSQDGIQLGHSVAIKSYARFPRHWRYSQRIYAGRIAIIDKIEHDPINNTVGYRINLDAGKHRWFVKDFSAIRAVPLQVVSDLFPKICPRCRSNALDLENAPIDVVDENYIHKTIFCDGCGSNIILKYKFCGATAIPL